VSSTIVVEDDGRWAPARRVVLLSDRLTRPGGQKQITSRLRFESVRRAERNARANDRIVGLPAGVGDTDGRLGGAETGRDHCAPEKGAAPIRAGRSLDPENGRP
jgi:hypothetical protein